MSVLSGRIREVWIIIWFNEPVSRALQSTVSEYFTLFLSFYENIFGSENVNVKYSFEGINLGFVCMQRE